MIMQKELLAIEFRYHDRPEDVTNCVCRNKTITIGVFDMRRSKMNNVKISDKVVCANNSGYENELNVGKTYTVIATDYDDFTIDGTF